ncbi:MAG: sensor histidine kinase [Myxococcota bacterium]
MLENVLELSRLESGRFELHHDSFDAVSLVQDCVEMFGFAAHGKGLALVADMEPTLVPHRIGDPARVRQILVNLVGNAVKFTAVGCVEVSLRDVAAGSGLEIEVLDTGPGIPRRFSAKAGKAARQPLWVGARRMEAVVSRPWNASGRSPAP